MNKLTFIFLLMFAVLINASGQFSGIGGGITLSSGFRFHDQAVEGNKSGTIGASLKSVYKISDPFQISPSFTFFFPHVTKGSLSKQSISSMMFDINGQYILNPTGRIEFYGIAGLDILFAANNYSSGGSPTSKETDNGLGLNFGFGTSLKITEILNIYGEAKYVFNNKYNQFMINAGILFSINLMKKPENSDH